MWVARDKDGTLCCYFYEKPKRLTNWWLDSFERYVILEREKFPDLKWEDEPIEVELIRKEKKMKQEDKQFLAELAHELNTQDNCATRNPVWCIMDKHYVITEEGCGDEYRVVCDEVDYSLCGFAMNVVDDWELKEEDNSLLLDEIESCTTTDELEDILEEYCVDYRRGSVSLYEATLEDFISHDATGFLTKKSAEEHLRLNAHHYHKEARAYALSAWRNPVYERLINIIKETKWEEEI